MEVAISPGMGSCILSKYRIILSFFGRLQFWLHIENLAQQLRIDLEKQGDALFIKIELAMLLHRLIHQLLLLLSRDRDRDGLLVRLRLLLVRSWVGVSYILCEAIEGSSSQKFFRYRERRRKKGKKTKARAMRKKEQQRGN
jgi:hypothetical protein